MASRRKDSEDLSGLYLGCFDFERPGDSDWNGSFQVVVQAASPNDAAERMRKRLRTLRTTTSLFDEPCTIILNGMIHLVGSFDEGVLVNWRAGTDAVEVLCMIPEQPEHHQKGYEPARENGAEEEPFLDFGGLALRKALASARKPPTDAVPLPSPEAAQSQEREAIRPTQPRSKPRKEQAKKPSQVKSRSTVRERKQARLEAIDQTLAEIGVVTKGRRSRA